MRGARLLIAIGCAAALGCSAPVPAPAPMVTGLVIAIDYTGQIATISVGGSAEASGRRFGPWTLDTNTLVSGGTVGFVFDPSDAGGAMVCATARDSFHNTLDVDCNVFQVRPDQVVDGMLSLDGNHTR
jgi:hypothetical protein